MYTAISSALEYGEYWRTSFLALDALDMKLLGAPLNKAVPDWEPVHHCEMGLPSSQRIFTVWPSELRNATPITYKFVFGPSH